MIIFDVGGGATLRGEAPLPRALRSPLALAVRGVPALPRGRLRGSDAERRAAADRRGRDRARVQPVPRPGARAAKE